jgi:hypothetical protein
VDQKVDGPSRLLVFPGADGRFELYDDDGHSTGYSTGYMDGSDKDLLWLDITWSQQDKTLSIRPSPRMQRDQSRTKAFRIENIVSGRQVQVEFTGEPLRVGL